MAIDMQQREAITQVERVAHGLSCYIVMMTQVPCQAPPSPITYFEGTQRNDSAAGLMELISGA
jgi:hypothetical protein